MCPNCSLLVGSGSNSLVDILSLTLQVSTKIAIFNHAPGGGRKDEKKLNHITSPDCVWQQTLGKPDQTSAKCYGIQYPISDFILFKSFLLRFLILCPPIIPFHPRLSQIF